MSKYINLILLIATIALSYLTSEYVGNWYANLVPHYGSWIYDKADSIKFSGFLLSYTFFTPLVFGLFGRGKKNWWTAILLAPVLLFYLYAKASLFYIPLLAAIAGCLIAKLINFVYKKVS